MSYTSKSKTLNNACEKHPHVAECYSDSDGYWVHTVSGYVSADDECGTIRGDTVKDCLNGISSIEKGLYVDGHSVPAPLYMHMKPIESKDDILRYTHLLPVALSNDLTEYHMQREIEEKSGEFRQYTAAEAVQALEESAEDAGQHRNIRDFMIAIGWMKEVDEIERQGTVRSGGGGPLFIKHKGKYYSSVYPKGLE